MQVTVEDANPNPNPNPNPNQVTVEDANPEFRMLRDLTDVRNCKRRGLLTPASCEQAPLGLGSGSGSGLGSGLTPASCEQESTEG